MCPNALFLGLAGLILGACGGTSTTSTSEPSRLATPSLSPPSPAPSATPDTETVEVLKVGVGAYMIQAQPVAILRSSASSHSASQVVVHFAVHAGNGARFLLDGPPLSLAPGEVAGVAALCTASCTHAASVDATVSVGFWSPGSRPTIVAAAAGYVCGSCGPGSGYGSVQGTLSGSIASGTPVIAVASCENAAGAIVGGGSADFVWPPPSALSISVLVSTAPAGCHLYATAE